MASPLTVVLDESCLQLEDAVAKFSPVQVFRRAEGFCCESKVAAAELQSRLVDWSIAGRAIYVASSFAGFTALLLAAQYPGLIRGVLLVDPSHPRQGAEALQILAELPKSSEVDSFCRYLQGFGPAWTNGCHDVAEIRKVSAILHVLAAGQLDLAPFLPEYIKERLLRSRHRMLSEYCLLSSDSSFDVVAMAGHDICKWDPDTVISGIKKLLNVAGRPNQSPEPTGMLVTPRADARVAPSTPVAHL